MIWWIGILLSASSSKISHWCEDGSGGGLVLLNKQEIQGSESMPEKYRILNVLSNVESYHKRENCCWKIRKSSRLQHVKEISQGTWQNSLISDKLRGWPQNSEGWHHFCRRNGINSWVAEDTKKMPSQCWERVSLPRCWRWCCCRGLCEARLGLQPMDRPSITLQRMESPHFSREKCKDKESSERCCSRLTTTPIPRPPAPLGVGQRSQEWRSEVEPRK